MESARALQQYSYFETQTPSWALVDVKTFIDQGYRKNALAYRCVEFLAAGVGMASLEAKKIGPDGETDLPDRDLLNVLINKPSPAFPSQAQFFRQVVRSLYVAGEAPLYKVKGNQTGTTRELQFLPPEKIAIHKKPNGEKVYHYHYDPGEEPKVIKEDELIFLKFDGIGTDRGMSPLMAAARETDVDNAAADIRKTFFENGSMLDGILSTEQPANDTQLKQWSALWRERFGGRRNAAKTPALAGGLKYQELGSTPDRWAFPDVTGLSEARICSAFGLPPILVGAKVGLDRATYANYKEARSAAWEDTISPLLNFLAEALTDSLTEEGDLRKLVWNTDDVPAFQEDADAREERAGRGFKLGTITLNEYRDAIGLEPVPDGDVYFVPNGVVLIRAGELNVDRTPPALQVDPEEEPEEEEPEEEEAETDDSPGPIAVSGEAETERALSQAIGAVLRGWSKKYTDPEQFTVSVESARMAEAITPVLLDLEIEGHSDLIAFEVAQDLSRDTQEILMGRWSGTTPDDVREAIRERSRADLAAEQVMEKAGLMGVGV